MFCNGTITVERSVEQTLINQLILEQVYYIYIYIYIHYNHIKTNLVVILLTDTDRLIYKIEIESVYSDFYKNSIYSKVSNYHDNSNKLVVGKIKDET